MMNSRTIAALHRDYGMTALSETPSGMFLPFATTGEFFSLARNHCCSVMVMNLLLQEFPEYCRKFSRRELFLRIHAMIGNGPVLSLRRANRFLQKEGIPGQFEQVPLPSLFSHSALQSVPCPSFQGFPASSSVEHSQGEAAPHWMALLIAAGPFDWHWVLAVPTAPSKESRMKKGQTFSVMTGWDSSKLFCWKSGQKARLLSVWIFSAVPHSAKPHLRILPQRDIKM